MEHLKTVAKVIGGVLAFGLWVVACPEVKRHEERGRCWESVTYAGVYSRLSDVDC